MTEASEFRPEEILRTLESHAVEYVLVGGLAATLWGSPHVTFDVDIAPSRSRENLERLARALNELDARVRTEGVPDGLAFDRSAEFLERVSLLNLQTRLGALDLCFVPTGTGGYDDLREDAVEFPIRGLRIRVASLADIIRSKEAAGRDKDRLTLPALRKIRDRERS